MDNMDEIKELLRDIRDLQKAHFERYKEFTQAALDRQQTSHESLARSREETHRYREEMRRTLEETQAKARNARILSMIFLAIAIVFSVLCLGGSFLPFIFRM